MILPPAVSNWPYLIPMGQGEEVCRSGSLLARPLVRCDTRGGCQLPINHNCFNSINHVFRRKRGNGAGKTPDFAGLIFIVMSGPQPAAVKGVTASGALSACLALIVLDYILALAQARFYRNKKQIGRPACAATGCRANQRLT